MIRPLFAALLLWLSLASVASADISFVNGGPYNDNGTVGTTLSVSFTVSSSANRILVVFEACSDSVNCTATVTYNGVSLSGPFASSGTGDGLFILVNPPSGSNTLLVTDTNCSGPNCFIAVLPTEYAGAAQTGQPDTTGAFTTDGVVEDTYTTTVGPTVADRAWIIGVVLGGGGGTPANSMAAPFTARINGGGGSFVMMGDAGPITPAGTVSFAATMQNSGSLQSHSTISIAPAPAAGTLVPLTPGTIFCRSILARLANCHAALTRSVGEVYA